MKVMYVVMFIYVSTNFTITNRLISLPKLKLEEAAEVEEVAEEVTPVGGVRVCV